eukprot:Gregarina_sp_Pseudo_9__2338@NODE_264_length_3359_cov_2970_012349_g247_i0_p1_GENE_NODE_264_length_3359_cov_2970_012349_g247_i0NODE_264_length_3359_cov_2970_012349_g247_i0_p1_ORF_typecomplete_len576_score124_37PhoD/PF09423_10/1_3e19_NODE_264_length_3359_cov_2970_012349_g247_i0641791
MSASSSSSGSYTSSSDAETSSTSTSSYHAGSSSGSYWTTDKILARHAAGTVRRDSTGPISAPPNSSLAYEPKRAFPAYVSLGPVIGMVTDTTARVLIETSETCQVKCFLTDKYGVQHGCTRKCQRHVPTVFTLEELRADTYYKVTFDLPVPGLVKSGFKTLAPGWNLARNPARIGVVSTTDFVAMRDNISHKNDLWKHLYSQCKRGEVDYLFHLGNLAFVDRNPEKGSEPSALEEAAEYCRGLHGEMLADAERHVCTLFRNVYRDTWTHPTLRHVLANVPNLMILNDHEIKLHLGDEQSEGADPTYKSYIAFCAYKVYNEYCRGLFEDVAFQRVGGGSLSSTMKVGQAYHFHAFGEVGFVFLDTRAQRSLHRDWASDDNLGFLGHKQWSDLDYALSPGGYLADCKVLLVCMSAPVAQCGEQAYLKASRDTEMQGSWNTPAHAGEASLLLGTLFDWKAHKPGRRQVMILAGSSSDAGVTEITDLRYKGKGDSRVDRMKQVTAGPTGALPNLKSATKLSNAKCGHTGLGVYHNFKHLRVVKKSNYAIIDIAKVASDQNAVVDVYHVEATPKAFVVRK